MNLIKVEDHKPVCEICHNKFSNSTQRIPKLLSCLHSFCQSCLVSNIRDDSLECPQCKVTTPVPDSSLENLRDDFTLEFTLVFGDGEKQYTCGNCEDNPKHAIWGCIDCFSEEENGVALCDNCLVHHGKFKAFRNHSVVPIDDFQLCLMQSLKTKAKRCKFHPNKDIELCCKQCHVSICQICSLNDHNGHRIDWLLEGAKKERSKILERCSKLDENISIVEHEDGAIVQHLSQLDTNKEEAHRLVDAEYNRFITFLESKRQATHTQIELSTSSYRESMMQLKKKIEFQLENTHSSSLFAKRAVVHSSDLNLYEFSNEIQTRLGLCQSEMLQEVLRAKSAVGGQVEGESFDPSTPLSSLLTNPNITVSSHFSSLISNTPGEQTKKENEALISLMDRLLHCEIQFA